MLETLDVRSGLFRIDHLRIGSFDVQRHLEIEIVALDLLLRNETGIAGPLAAILPGRGDVLDFFVAQRVTVPVTATLPARIDEEHGLFGPVRPKQHKSRGYGRSEK